MRIARGSRDSFVDLHADGGSISSLVHPTFFKDFTIALSAPVLISFIILTIFSSCSTHFLALFQFN